MIATRVVLAVGMLVALARTRDARSMPSCAASCDARMLSCRAERCPGATGATGRTCRNRCRATTGCAAGAARIRTLATVVTECRSGPSGWTAQQRLEVRRGDCAPVTLMTLETPRAVPDPLALCALYGRYRSGYAYVIAGAFERLAVSPDGTNVVFEVTQQHAFAPFAPPSLAIPQEGIFIARSDGTDLHRIGPASRAPLFRVSQSDLPPGIDIVVNDGFQFSTDGRLVVYTDRGAGADGSDAEQLVTIDVTTGNRRQLTAFNAGTQGNPTEPDVNGHFLDDRTIIGFVYDTTTDRNFFTVQRDGSGLQRFVPSVPVPGSRIDSTFQLLGRGRNVRAYELPAMTTLPYPGHVHEVFVHDGDDLVQLTKFGRADTLAVALSHDANRIFLAASADPFGHNPKTVCQLFSIDRFGAHLRQLTAFQPAATNVVGCFKGTEPPSCRIEIPLNLDTKTNALVFGASCDPFGLNPLGGQIFTVRTDGSGLRQLTNYHGMVTDPDGTVTVELPGPTRYSVH